jgi:hypothetical protein
MCASTILRRLRECGIPVRRRGPEPGTRRPPAWSDEFGWSCPDEPRWSAEIAWIVGLIATDGNLANTGRALSISSADVQLLETVRTCLGLTNRILPAPSNWGTRGLRLQWRNRSLYRWLTTIGLTPRKSLTLGPLAVPDEYFADFFRGCIDGDGTVLVYTDTYHVTKKASYVYCRLYVSLISASQTFVDWIRATIHRLMGIAGSVQVRRKPGRNPIWVLRYAKKDSIRLLRWIYRQPDAPCLLRKRAKAEPFLLKTP